VRQGRPAGGRGQALGGPRPLPRVDREAEALRPAWLDDRTILLARHGSHAYGLAIETSDEDWKGVAIPPPEVLFGFTQRFEQAESHAPDVVIYDLRKFMTLAAECNPSIVEVLWTEPTRETPLGARLRESRALFLSKKAKHTFSGYALAQLKRIKTHHRWLANPPAAPPTREDFGLPERGVVPRDQLLAAQAAIAKKVGEWELDFLHDVDPASRILLQTKMSEALAEMKVASESRWAAAARTIGYDENFLELLDRERRFTAAQREHEQHAEWKRSRNPARAALEAKHGYDTKHAMHLVRLLRMCREILTTGEVVVKRPDREDLLAIRAGAWSYDRLIAWAETEDAELERLYPSSKLPTVPDRDALDRLCVELVESSLVDD
jgi:predicted nucleotidyltransferase